MTRHVAHVLRDSTNPLQEAKLFVQTLLGLSALSFLENLHAPFPPTAYGPLQQALDAYTKEYKPFSRWLCKRTFLDHTFQLNPWTLDPRPESEGLVLLLQEHLPHLQTLLDLGTGSGCLLLSLLALWPNARGVGVDKEERVFDVARQNAAAIGIEDRVTWLHSDWCAAVEGLFDCIVCNPPYIQQEAPLPPEVRLWDPPLALFAGDDGLDAYRCVIPQAAQHLTPGGLLALEIGQDQAEAVYRLLTPLFQQISIHKDLAGYDRYILARCP